MKVVTCSIDITASSFQRDTEDQKRELIWTITSGMFHNANCAVTAALNESILIELYNSLSMKTTFRLQTTLFISLSWEIEFLILWGGLRGDQQFSCKFCNWGPKQAKCCWLYWEFASVKMERIFLIYFQVPRCIDIVFSVLRCFMMILFAFIPFYSLYTCSV